MNDVNWWLMAVAFLLGLVLTLFSMVGRVQSHESGPQEPAEEK
jgi:cytochrome oxidase Cu insertion factor (SCO1/SenC/PrrC family)